MNIHGRPTVLDDVKKIVIYSLLQVGASRRTAAAVVGISEATIRYAIKHDAEFAQRVAQAEALLEVELLVKLRQNAGRSWRASAYALEKLRPEKYANKPDQIDQETERELIELELAAKKQPPQPPDPNDPTTASSRRFHEQLEKLLAASLSPEPTATAAPFAIENATTNNLPISILDNPARSITATLDIERALRS